MLLEENCMSSTSRVVYAFIRTTYRPSSSPCFNLFFLCLFYAMSTTSAASDCWLVRYWLLTIILTACVVSDYNGRYLCLAFNGAHRAHIAKQYAQFARIALSAWCLLWESAGFHPLKSEGMQLVMPPLGSEKPWQTMIKRFLMNGIMFICGFYPCVTFLIGAPVRPQVMNVFH